MEKDQTSEKQLAGDHPIDRALPEAFLAPREERVSCCSNLRCWVTD